LDEQELIRLWASGGSLVKTAIELPENPSSPWERLVASTNAFDSNRIYMLVAGPSLHGEARRSVGLSALHWTLILDFDPNGAEMGLGHVLQPLIRKQYSMHEVALGDRPPIRPSTSSYWYYARGMTRRASTLVGPSWVEWKRKYGLDLQDQLTRLAAGRESCPVTVVSIWDEEDYVDAVFSAALNAFGSAIDFVIASPSASKAIRLGEKYGAALIDIEPNHIAEGLAAAYGDGASLPLDGTLFPTKSGVRSTLSVEDEKYLKEELDIVGINAGTLADEEREVCLSFYKGKEITWFELGLHCDVDRESSDRIQKVVRQDLGGGADRRSRGTTRINIFHSPGAGGSTVARRILWNLHLDFPAVKLRQTLPEETAQRIEFIYKMTGLPVLVLIEGAEIQEAMADDLYSIVRARQVPAAFLQVLRRFTKPQERERSFFLESELSTVESTRFAHRLAEAKPSRKARLIDIAAQGTREERSAFYFALEAFEAEFQGLGRYVSARLEDATNEQQKVLLYLAIAYHYGQQSIAPGAFSSILSLPASLPVDLTKVLPDYMRQLLRSSSGGHWRPAHDLIAMQIIRQILAPRASDDRVWKQNLSMWAGSFIEFCRGDDPIPSSDLVALLSRCFLFRDNRDPLGKESPEQSSGGNFSHLLQDIPSVQGRLTTLVTLTEIFPMESHFWGHLGRFLAIEMKDFTSAIQALDKALELDPEDHVLYHMKGMALRGQVFELMQNASATPTKADLEQCLLTAAKAAEQFDVARSKQPNDEHGYVSHIQMIFRLVEFARVVLKAASNQDVLISPYIGISIRESIDLAEDLLEQARKLREGERQSPHVEKCRVQLDSLYGDFNSVLQGWTNLLSRSDVYRPTIRRQLVYAYVARRERRWDRLASGEVNRVVELLEQNLTEEPNDRRNLRLWMQAVRRIEPARPIDQVIERVSYWKSNSSEIDAVYYLYVLHSLKAMQGFSLSVDAMEENLDECRKRSRLIRVRTGSFEWLGKGEGIAKLVHYSELEGWDADHDFWSNTGKLVRVKGTIATMSGPESGQIEVARGVKAFFVPGKSGHLRGRDENRAVEFFLGFSYDGLRAWEVKSV
jgi:tetratricopeptide (TPR) repeat protein